MSGTHPKPGLASYRDTVTELMKEGAPFGDVEDAINAHDGLTEDQKAALWLLAFSLRDRSEQQHDAWAHLTAVQVAAGDSEITDQRTLGDAMDAALSEQAAAERYRRLQREARSGKARPLDGPRPREFDANGFPVAQRNRSLIERVAGMLNPS